MAVSWAALMIEGERKQMKSEIQIARALVCCCCCRWQRESDVWLLKKMEFSFIFKRKKYPWKKEREIRVGWFVNNTHSVRLTIEEGGFFFCFSHVHIGVQLREWGQQLWATLLLAIQGLRMALLLTLTPLCWFIRGSFHLNGLNTNKPNNYTNNGHYVQSTRTWIFSS